MKPPGTRPRGPRPAGVFVLVLAAACAATAARAQEPDTTAAKPSTAAEAARQDTTPVLPLPALVVRALRAPIVADALPYAVTVRQPASSVRSAGLSLGGEIRAVPGLQVQSRYNDALGDRIVMRGFGARAQFGVRGIQVLVDGVPATMPDGQTTLNHLDLSLLERAEVLRGPAAAAYGNAAGGVLLLSLRPPPAGAFHQELGAVGGADGLVRIRSTTGGGGVGANGPDAADAADGGGVGWIASLTGERRDGYRPHSGTERYQATGRLDLPVAGGSLRAVAHGVAYDADNPGALTFEQYREDPHQAQAFNVAQRTGEEGRHGQAGLTWERSLSGVRLEGTVYGLARSVENPIPPTIISLSRRAAGARVLLHGPGPAVGLGRLSWAVGADASMLGDDRQNYENASGDRGPLTLDQRERVTNLAAHGQAILSLLDPLSLFLGARYDHVVFSATERFVAGEEPDDSGERTMGAASPTLGLRLALSPDVTLFGNVSTAFETPTTTELVNRPDGRGGLNEELEPQRTVSYEIGTRGALGPALRLEGTAYHARVDDALIPFEVASAPGRQYFRNAGAAVHRGIELLAELRAERLNLLVAFSRTDAEFSSHTVGDRSFDGNAVPGVRPWTLGIVAGGDVPGGLTLESEYERVGEMAVDDANESWAAGYGLVGLRAAAPRISIGGWDIQAYGGVDNVLDRSYVASVVPNAFGSRFFEPGPGRALYVGLRTMGTRR